MPSLNESISHDDASLLALGQAFEAVLTTLKSHDPFHDWDRDVERRTELAKILLELGAAGLTDPNELRSRALGRLPLVPQSTTLSARNAERSHLRPTNPGSLAMALAMRLASSPVRVFTMSRLPA
jgi:hypothetical protein